MAIDIFMQVPTAATTLTGSITVTGESLDLNHPQWIAIKSYDFGIENPTSIGSTTTGAGPSGKAKFNDLMIKKNVDTASPSLFSAASLGPHFPTVTLAVRMVGTAGSNPDYLIYTFKYVIVTQVEWTADGSDGVEEAVSLIFGAMQISYAKQNPDGSMAKPTTAIWNVISNTASLTVPS